MLAVNIDKSTRRAATVLTLLGTDVQDIARTLPAVEGAAADEYSQLTAKLKTHFDASVNATYERAQLQALVRKDGESFALFVSRLRLQAERCNYPPEQRENSVLECAVARCADRELQRKFFAITDLTLPRALEMAKREEEIRAQVCELNAGFFQRHAPAVHLVQEQCSRCNSRKHAPTECPFRNKHCFRCNKKGHS